MYDPLCFCCCTRAASIPSFNLSLLLLVQGAEDEIRAKFYAIAFRQVFSEEESVVRWEIIEYELVGDTPYL